MDAQFRVHRPGVLLVDKDEEARETLDQGLCQEGFTVWVAGASRAALDLYERHRHEIDFVLMEVCMPEMDGPQTLAALQKLNREVRCYFMTSGYTGTYTEEELLAMGARTLLHKPFEGAEVAPVLRRQLGAPQRGPHRSPACPSVLSWRHWARARDRHDR
jgi:two-component system cell cycle sensor histidine kinase/response regulator CckA